MVQFAVGVFVGALLTAFVFALLTAGEDDHENRRR